MVRVMLGAALLVLSSATAAQETRETIGGWTLEERGNPQEPRDYSVVVTRSSGPVTVVASRSTVRGRSAHMLAADCTDISYGGDLATMSLSEQTQALRESFTSSYADSRKECRLPALDPKLLAGFDEAYRAMDARFRTNRPPAPSLDRSQTAGGWAVDETRDPGETDEPGKRFVTMSKSLGGLKLSQKFHLNLLFDDLFFTDNSLSAEYSDCRREETLDKLEDTGGPPETAAQRKAIVAVLQTLEQDCQLPHATVIALLSDYAPAFTLASQWTRGRLAEHTALANAATAYEQRLAGESEPQAEADPAASEAAAAAEAAADAAVRRD